MRQQVLTGDEPAGGANAAPDRQGATTMLAAVSGLCIYAAGSAILAAGLAVEGRRIGLSETEIGTILSLGAFAGVVTAPLWGYASERWNRRTPILLAMPFVAIGPGLIGLVLGNAAALSLAFVYVSLIVARLLHAAFGAALIPLTQSYLADSSSPRLRVSVMGLLGAAFSLGTVCGSTLLWATAPFGLASGLYVLAGLGLAAFLFTATHLPEVPRRRNVLPEEARVPLSRTWPNFAISLAGYSAYSIVQPIVALRIMDRFAADAVTATGRAGLVLAGASLSLVLAQAYVATRSGWNAAAMLVIGSLFALGGMVALTTADSVLPLAGAMIVVGLALGFMVPANLGMLSLATGGGAQGKVGGINAAARGLGIAIGPITGTALYGVDQDAPLWAATALLALVAVLSMTAGAINRRPPTA
jgi:MFS family permease